MYVGSPYVWRVSVCWCKYLEEGEADAVKLFLGTEKEMKCEAEGEKEPQISEHALENIDCHCKKYTKYVSTCLDNTSIDLSSYLLQTSECRRQRLEFCRTM